MGLLCMWATPGTAAAVAACQRQWQVQTACVLVVCAPPKKKPRAMLGPRPLHSAVTPSFMTTLAPTRICRSKGSHAW